MRKVTNVLRLYDFAPEVSDLRREVLQGLTQKQKSIPPKFLYDERGSELFEKICQLNEYYPTRTEMAILRSNAWEMARFIGPDAVLIEPGAGTGVKLQILLKHLDTPSIYLPIEIEREVLIKNAEKISSEHPHLRVIPVCADYTQDLNLPPSLGKEKGRRVIFFPGSTIGNFDPYDAVNFLSRIGFSVGRGGGLLIGVDLKKDPRVIEKAYDDSEGVTAEFNLNLLKRLNRELSATFDLGNFSHTARYDASKRRVEMHLISRVPQLVQVSGNLVRFGKNETIHTESSYKYSVEEFCELAMSARFIIQKYWKDPAELFCVYYFERA